MIEQHVLREVVLRFNPITYYLIDLAHHLARRGLLMRDEVDQSVVRFKKHPLSDNMAAAPPVCITELAIFAMGTTVKGTHHVIVGFNNLLQIEIFMDPAPIQAMCASVDFSVMSRIRFVQITGFVATFDQSRMPPVMFSGNEIVLVVNQKSMHFTLRDLLNEFYEPEWPIPSSYIPQAA